MSVNVPPMSTPICMSRVSSPDLSRPVREHALQLSFASPHPRPTPPGGGGTAPTPPPSPRARAAVKLGVWFTESPGQRAPPDSGTTRRLAARRSRAPRDSMAGRGHARPSRELARSIGERRRGGDLDTGCREIGRGDEASHEAVPFGGAAAVRDAKYVTLAARRRQFAIGARPPPVPRPRIMAGMTRTLRDRLDGWRGEQIELPRALGESRPRHRRSDRREPGRRHPGRSPRSPRLLHRARRAGALRRSPRRAAARRRA